MQFPRAGAESFSEDRPLGWDPAAAGSRAGDGMARFVSEEKAPRNTPEYNFNKRYTMEPITVNYKVLDPRAKVPCLCNAGGSGG